MADPTIQTFCCHHRNQSDFAVKLMSEFDKDSYILTCMISSSIGILGAVYQIFFRTETRRSINQSTTTAIGRDIIIALAIADLCASVGIFLRSAFWKFVRSFLPMGDDKVNVVFCATSSAWTQFFYTATWLYTLLYAISVYVLLKGGTPPLKKYHTFVWSMSAVLTAVGLTILYVPNADCHDIHQFSTALLRVLPIYIVTYVPILAVMIANPIIYFISSKKFDQQLAVGQSQITQNERTLMKRFKLKFLFVNLIFFICWFGNLFSGILLWFFWANALPVKTIIATWYVVAFLNPLQAFMNMLVYRKWTKITILEKIRKLCRRKPRIVESRSLSERSPLLRYENNHRLNGNADPHINHEHSVNTCSCV